MINNYYIKLFIVDIFKYLIQCKVYLCYYFFKQQANSNTNSKKILALKKLTKLETK